MTLGELRKEIDAIDSKIIGLIAKRQQIAGKIAREKAREGLPVHDASRTREVLGRAFDQAVEQKINPVFAQEIFKILIEMSEERQHECSGEGNLP
jgi:chorismate mutase